MPQLLLELFSEEIPARMQGRAARDLERMASERLKAAGLSFEALTTYAGPRRLTLVVEGLATATPDRSEEMKGPRTSAPEQALAGFLKKTGLSQGDLSERDGVWFAQIEHKGVRTTDVVADMVEQIVRTFPWPKSMRWGTGTLRWVRPLKRIVCLFDGAVVPFEIDGIPSGDVTEGHRFMGSGAPFTVADYADYRRKLEAECVLLDAADRRLKILEAAQAACHTRGLDLVDDDGLLDEVAGLAEWPTPILGDMDPAFLDLPPEVVRLSMKVHQKYFAVREGPSTSSTATDPTSTQTGRLAPHFVVVANVEASDGGKALAAGNARVLSARLNDARFFWDEDLKTGFDAWNAKLSGVTFHAKLGTLKDRVERIAALAREIAPLVGADPDQAENAARLCKADLASGMVGEFPELQGIMGGYYARLEGNGETPGSALQQMTGDPIVGETGWMIGLDRIQADAIADAIRDHYKPQGPGDTVPTAPITVAVALADKLDTLVGFFAIDEKPTGSKDPFALRRAALGVIRLLLESEVRIGMRPLIRRIYAKPILVGLADKLQRQDQEFRDEIEAASELIAVHGLGAAEVTSNAVIAMEQQSREADLENDPEYVQARDALISGALSALGERKQAEYDLLAFFADRLKVLLRDQGKRHDLVDAVFALGDDDLVRIVRRVEALSAFLATDDGANLLAGYKRASNILKAEAKKGPVPTGMVNTGMPDQPEAEMALAMATETTRNRVTTALETEDFTAAMTALSGLRGPVDVFLTDVMVNSDVESERENRLKLLGQVRDVMGQVADFGQVAG